MKKFIFLLCVMLAAFASFLFLHDRYLPVTYEKNPLTETSALLDNPYCGFYELHGYTLAETESIETAADWGEKCFSKSSSSLILLEMNLKNYRDSYLSSNALSQLDAILSAASKQQKQLILRCLYDWDGNALETEPSSIEQIEQHMEQLSSVINRHADCVYIMQGNFTGNVGEMNQTNYGSAEDTKTLVEYLSNCIFPSIYLSVRTPAQLRGVLESREIPSFSEIYSGTLASRLGLYNDGMLGSVYDLGTYDDTPYTSSDKYTEKGTRSQELEYQNRLCLFVPNGGEAVIDNEYSDLENAVSDLSAMHVSYLNKDHDLAVLDKWKNTFYQGDDIFQGCSGYDYISAHLGYRYVITDSSLTFRPLLDDTALLHLTIENRGFAPAYKKFETQIYLTNIETKEVIPVTNTIDNRMITSENSFTFKLSIDVRDMEKGTWQISIDMTDSLSNLPVFFANETENNRSAVLLGTLRIP